MPAPGISKKKLRHKRKADARVGAKAKEKAKKIQQIKGREQIKASKRKAAALSEGRQGSQSGRDDDDDAALDGLDSVDALFASDAFASDDTSDGEAASDGDESSAGAFCDVADVGGDDDEGDDDGLPQDDIEGLDDEDEENGLGAGARHEEELQAIKEKDPDFYKFLVENDRALLDFRAPDEEAGGAAEEGAEEDDAETPGETTQEPAAAKTEQPLPGKVLNLERFRRLQESASLSITAFKACVNCYHLAVRSIEEREMKPDEEADEKDGKKRRKGNKKDAKKQKRKERQTLLRIEDEATFSEVLEWSIANMVPLFKQHAGELQAKSSAGPGGKRDKQRRASDALGLVDPTGYTRWRRVKVLTQIFWEETFFLLSHLMAPQMLEFVLRTCSTPEALSWLWPFKTLRQRFFRRCCSLWSTASSHKVRLLAFLFIRNSAAMSLHFPDLGKGTGTRHRDVPQLETIVRTLLKSFADVASLGYSWRSLSTFRFMENCLLELLRLNDAMAYRVGYAHIRQLALVLRNACIATSQSSDKGKKRKGAQQQAQALIGWPFVRSIYLWTKAVGSVAVLRPLAYPLSMVIMGAVKSKLTSLRYYPFVHHCLQCMNRLGSSLEVFVPVSSHLLKALGVVTQAMDKAHRKRGLKGGAGHGLGASKAPELEVILRFTDGQLAEPLSLEAVGSSVCYLLTDHLGLLSQSPAFPEISAPVLMHVKRFSKHCRSEPLRRQLKALQTAAETSSADVCSQREVLTEVPSWKKFLMLDAKTAIAKSRVDLLQRKTSEERSRVEAEMQAEEQPSKGQKADVDDKAAKKREKRAAQKKKRKERMEAEKNGQRMADGAEAAKLARAPHAVDAVEEMEFSSEGDDE